MAGKGPFAPVEQAPIADTRLVATTLPASAAEGGAGFFPVVAKGLEAATTITRDHFETGIKDELRDDLDALEQGLAGVRDPVVQQQIFDAAARGNPFFQKAKQEFVRLADAIKQGRLPSSSAELRAKGILGTAITGAPEFSDELRAEAKSALGFSPEAAVFRSLLSEPRQGEKSPEQIASEQLRIEAFKTGRSVEEVQSAALQMAENKLESSKLNLDLLRGTATTNNIISASNKESANAFIESFGIVQTMITSNGGIPDAEQLKITLGAKFDTMRENAIAALPPTTDPAVVGRYTQNFNDRKRALMDMINDGSFQNLMTKRANTIGALIKNRLFQDPVLATLHTAVGGEGMLEYVSFMARYDTPAKFEAALQANPSLNGLTSIADLGRAMAQEISMQSNGQPAETTQSRTLRGIWNAQQLRAEPETFKQETAAQAVDAMITDLGEVSTFEQYEDSKVLVNVKKSGKLGKQFANLLATNKAANLADMTDALSKEFTQGIDIEIENGQYMLSGLDSMVSSAALGATNEQASQIQRLRRVVKRVNNMLRIGSMYQSGGVVEFGTPETFLQEVRKVAPAPEGKTETIAPERVVRRYDPETKTFTEVVAE